MKQEQQQFVERLKTLAKGIQKGNVYPRFLRCVLFERDNNRLFGRTFNGYAHQRILIGGDVGKNARIAIEPAELLKALSAVTGEVQVELDTDQFTVTITNGKAKVRIFGEDGKDFFVEPTADNPTSLAGGFLLASMGVVAYAVSSEESRPALCAVYVNENGGNAELVATDGRIVARRFLNGSVGLPVGGLLIHSSSVDILAEHIREDSKVTLSPSFITVENDDTLVSCRLIDETYPDYQPLLPDSTDWHSVMADKKEVLSALRASRSLADNVAPYADIEFSEERVTIRTGSDRGETRYDLIALVDEALWGTVIRGNVDYLVPSIRAIATDEVEIRVQTGDKPTQIRFYPADNDEESLLETTVVLMNRD